MMAIACPGNSVFRAEGATACPAFRGITLEPDARVGHAMPAAIRRPRAALLDARVRGHDDRHSCLSGTITPEYAATCLKANRIAFRDVRI